MSTEMVRRDLDRLENIVERGLSTFIEVGKALQEIRDRQLYRTAGYETWDGYTRERWAMSSRFATYQIEASRVAGLIGTAVPTSTVLHEYTLRPLSNSHLTDEQKVDAWAMAVELASQEGEPVQEKHVRFVLEHEFDVEPPAQRNPRCPVCQVLLVCPRCGGKR